MYHVPRVDLLASTWKEQARTWDRKSKVATSCHVSYCDKSISGSQFVSNRSIPILISMQFFDYGQVPTSSPARLAPTLTLDNSNNTVVEVDLATGYRLLLRPEVIAL